MYEIAPCGLLSVWTTLTLTGGPDDHDDDPHRRSRIAHRDRVLAERALRRSELERDQTARALEFDRHPCDR